MKAFFSLPVAALSSFAAGLAAHQTKRVTNRIKGGFRPLTEHAVGVMTVSPFVFWIIHLLAPKIPAREMSADEWADLQRRTDAATIAGYFAAFLLFGSGVAFGWLLDALNKKEI
jgi:hypothetical protein